MNIDIKNNDFNQLDTIDMDIDFDDDLDGFGSTTVNESKPTIITADVDDYGNLQINNSNSHNLNGLQMMESVGSNSNYNDIDMEIDEDLIDDEDSFTNFKDDESDDREVKTKTGIFADFGDDEDLEFKDGEVVEKISKPAKKRTIASMFEDDEIEPELVSEDLLDERKGDMIDQGKLESDYLDRLAKRHKKTNVKGSYNQHFRIGGDPEKEREMLNHDLTPAATPGTSIGGSIPSGGTEGGESAGGDGGCGESIKTTKKRDLFENLLVVTGFTLEPTSDGTFVLKDLTDMLPEVQCNDRAAVLNQLKPYINDAIITPLQYHTKKEFSEPQDWINWYTPEMQQKYPKCERDIDYCKMIVQNLNK